MENEQVTPEEKVEGKEETKQAETKTYTEEELQKLLQSETDRKTTKALETAKAKWEEEYKANLEKAKSEAEKLASMSAEERARAEFQKEKDAWEKEKSSFEQEKMKLEATKLLSAEGLPISFVDYVANGTAEQVNENVKAFKDAWSKALDEAVTDKLKGKAPAASGLANKDIVNMTKEDFGKLSYKERSRMLSVDPDIVSKLKK